MINWQNDKKDKIRKYKRNVKYWTGCKIGWREYRVDNVCLDGGGDDGDDDDEDVDGPSAYYFFFYRYI